MLREKQGFSRKGVGGFTPIYARKCQKLGENDPSRRRGSGKQVTPGRRRGAGRGARLILGCCVCVCRRKRPLSQDGLDKGLVSQSPIQELGWDEEQRER